MNFFSPDRCSTFSADYYWKAGTFSEAFLLPRERLEVLLVDPRDLCVWSLFTTQPLYCLTFPQSHCGLCRLRTEFWSFSEFTVFHNSCFITYANFLLSEEWNEKQEMFIHVNRNSEWENAKANGHKLKYSCSGVQEGQMSFSSCVVRRLKLLLFFWHKLSQTVALNSASYSDIGTRVGTLWPCLQTFMNEVCLPTYPD